MSQKFSEDKLKKLNSVSPSFCLAKWLQVTIDLVNGTTHSCHHPKRHQVPLEELAKDPSALHNTQYKKEQRKKMLAGERPSECSYCWDMEDLGNLYSDRYIKSNDPWAWTELERIAKMPWEQNINPRYLEVMIDNTCNFSCAYCLADISTGVAAEMEKYGPYNITDKAYRMPEHKTKKDDRKPYVEAFEKWLPTIIQDLHVLRITGGEPLLSPLFWKLLTTLQQSQNQNLTLAINSHMKHDTKVIEKLTSILKTMITNGNIQNFELYTSLDTFGPQAEYIRHGLDYNKVIGNIQRFHELLPESKAIVMCTFNVLSISSFNQFLDNIIELKSQNKGLLLDISYLKNPSQLRADIASQEMVLQVESSLEKMNSQKNHFNAHEVNKLTNLLNWLKSPRDPVLLATRRADFFKYVTEYDKRKKKNFLEIFPDMRSFLLECKVAAFNEVMVSP